MSIQHSVKTAITTMYSPYEPCHKRKAHDILSDVPQYLYDYKIGVHGELHVFNKTNIKIYVVNATHSNLTYRKICAGTCICMP
jgi:hypothetical protein